MPLHGHYQIYQHLLIFKTLIYNNFLELLYFQGKSKRNKRIHVFIYNLPSSSIFKNKKRELYLESI